MSWEMRTKEKERRRREGKEGRTSASSLCNEEVSSRLVLSDPKEPCEF